MKRYFSLAMALFLITASVCGPSAARGANKPIVCRWVSLMAIATLDPAQMQNTPSWILGPNLYDTLVYPDPAKGIVPWLAESWKISADGLKYTFQLKKKVPFHDGTELTAEDVVFSMERLVSLQECTIAAYFRFIKPGTTKAIEKYAVEFNLTERSPQFLANLFLFKVLNKRLVMKNLGKGTYGDMGDYGMDYLRTHDTGSGPYTAIEHRVGDIFRMERFEKYPLEPWKPNSIDIVSIQTIPEAVTTVTKLKAGELDMGEWTLPARILNELKRDPNFSVPQTSTDGLWTCVLNNKKKPLDDPYVRKAVAYAFNSEAVMTQILGYTGGKRIRGPLPDSMRGGCTGIATYPYDPEKAKAMLKKSKYSAEDLSKMEMEIGSMAASERYTNIFLMFASDLKKIGLNVKITSTTWAYICQAARKPETAFHFVLQTQVPKTPHPLEFLNYYTKDAWGMGVPQGGLYYDNPAVAEALNEAKNASNPAEQEKYYCQAQKQIAEDAPLIFSHNDARVFPFWRYVKGYQPHAGDCLFEMRFNRFTMDTKDPLFQKNHGW